MSASSSEDNRTPANDSAAYLPAQEYTLTVTFRADAVAAMEIKQAMEDAANALIRPTKELASVVFTRGAEAVVRAAQKELLARCGRSMPRGNRWRGPRDWTPLIDLKRQIEEAREYRPRGGDAHVPDEVAAR